MKFPIIALTFLLLAVSALAEDAPAEKIDPKEIKVSLVPDKDFILPGEPLYLTLILKNNSKRTLFFWMSDDWNDDKSLKSRMIPLTAADKDGAKLPEFNWEKSRGFGIDAYGTFHIEKIPPGSEFEFRVFAPYWVTLDQPGSYTLSAAAKPVLSIAPPAGVDISERNYPQPTMLPRPFGNRWIPREGSVDADLTAIAFDATASTVIVVVPPDVKKLDEVTDALLKQAAAGENHEAREADKMLQVIPDERAIPWLVQKFNHGHPATETGDNFHNRYRSTQIDALYALAKFNNDAALDALKEALDTKAGNDDDSIHRAVCIYILRCPHPGAIPFLLTLIHDPDKTIRNAVLKAIDTKLPPEQAVPLLEEMVKDPESQISSWAKMYLERMSKIVRLKQMGLPTPTPYPER